MFTDPFFNSRPCFLSCVYMCVCEGGGGRIMNTDATTQLQVLMTSHSSSMYPKQDVVLADAIPEWGSHP